ncbi:DUF4153 domain-containing protein [Cohnella phaseoli]|uniref:Uncharacterized protein DUF4173 n=1 Tax=Cohnella phaseoli TaxID=456490 RepID=A0A3D9I5L0_9BACL|nr:DUF4173 domain-containing protein [Cohnella phaseoli]RED57083.1 uncharacterized protein DUF4173 [Cohnella phaseoli]
MLSSRKPLIGSSLLALIGAFALAAVHQYLFFDHNPGISFFLFIVFLYVYLFHDWKGRLKEATGFAWFLLAVILLLSLTYGLFYNPIFRVLNLLAIPGLVFVHLAVLRGSNRIAWWDIRIIGEALAHLIPRSLLQIPRVFRTLRAALFRRLDGERQKTATKIVIGLVFATPLLFVVIPLLASADGAFNKLLNGIPGWMSRFSLGELFGRTLWIVVFGILFAIYYWSFAKPPRPRKAATDKEDISSSPKPNIDSVVLTTLLLAVNAVYVLFVVIQFSYLFGAWDGMLPDGTTYAEYARRGFGELVAVSAINFALLIVSLTFSGTRKGVLNFLLYVLVGCSGVMLYSAYIRLAMYEEVYGYTYIRFLVHAFMIYLAFLLLIAALRIRTTLVPMAKCFIILSLAAYTLLNYVGMDRLIAENNIARFEETGKIDRYYLNNLSADAIPTLVDFAVERQDAELKELLVNRRARLIDESRDWQSFNLSVYSAKKAVHTISNPN